MATYDYLCKTCGKQFEHTQSMKDDALTQCLCENKGTVERLITGTTGIIFKGSGFYVTDYKKTSGSKENLKTNEANPEPKVESTTEPESKPASPSTTAS